MTMPQEDTLSDPMSNIKIDSEPALTVNLQDADGAAIMPVIDRLWSPDFPLEGMGGRQALVSHSLALILKHHLKAQDDLQVDWERILWQDATISKRTDDQAVPAYGFCLKLAVIHANEDRGYVLINLEPTQKAHREERSRSYESMLEDLSIWIIVKGLLQGVFEGFDTVEGLQAHTGDITIRSEKANIPIFTTGNSAPMSSSQLHEYFDKVQIVLDTTDSLNFVIGENVARSGSEASIGLLTNSGKKPSTMTELVDAILCSKYATAAFLKDDALHQGLAVLLKKARIRYRIEVDLNYCEICQALAINPQALVCPDHRHHYGNQPQTFKCKLHNLRF